MIAYVGYLCTHSVTFLRHCMLRVLEALGLIAVTRERAVRTEFCQFCVEVLAESDSFMISEASVVI